MFRASRVTWCCAPKGGTARCRAVPAREDAIIEALRQRYGHVSAERVLSGPGIENLYQALASLDLLDVPIRSAAEITQAGLAGHCVACRTAVDMFCAMLGEVAGNLALAAGAQGGVFIGGGIAPHFRGYLHQSKFRARFNAKGRMTSYVSPIPVYLILHDDPAFVAYGSWQQEPRPHLKSAPMSQIVTLTPNPAIDLSTAVDRIVPRLKLRCAQPRRDPGGGGVNVARVINDSAATSRPFFPWAVLLANFCGGFSKKRKFRAA